MWVIINIIWVTFVIWLIAFLLTYRYIWNGCDLFDLIVLSSIVFATVSFLWLLWSTFFISDSQLIETSKVISTRQLSKVRKINLSKINFKKGKQAKLITKKYSYKINQKSVSWYQKYIFYGELDLLLEAHLNTHYQYTVELPK